MSGRVSDAALRYDHNHRAERAAWAKALAAGEHVACARCGFVVLPAWPPPEPLVAPAPHVPTCTGRGIKGRKCEGECWARWEMGHLDGGGPRDYSGAEHFHCNRRAGGERGARITAGVRAERRRLAGYREHVSREP